MAVDKFPIEAGHIMLFARSIGDANPIYYDAEHAKASEAGAAIARRPLFKPALNSIPITSAAKNRRRVVWVKGQLASQKKRVPAAAVAVAACT